MTTTVQIDDLPAAPAVAFAETMRTLRAAAAGEVPERVLRVYTPMPTLAMSGWESRRPGFEAASAFAREHDFDPAVRPTGGRAATYDESCVVFDLIVSDQAAVDPRPLFIETSTRLAEAFQNRGVDARVGPVPGEYCPGEFSINARGAVKLIGTSQRAVRGARLLSGMIALGEIDPLLPVLIAANEALGLEWDPATFGGLAAEGAHLTREDVVAALREALAGE